VVAVAVECLGRVALPVSVGLLGLLGLPVELPGLLALLGRLALLGLLALLVGLREFQGRRELQARLGLQAVMALASVTGSRHSVFQTATTSSGAVTTGSFAIPVTTPSSRSSSSGR
jgi:hypothetical protein